MTSETAKHEPLPCPAAASGHVCPECGGPVEQPSKGRERVFCTNEHREAHKSRRTVRGKMLVGMAQGWRVNRGTGEVAKAAFQQMCAMLDEWNAEDRAAGRPRADLYTGLLLKQGDAIDRRNVRPTCTKGYQGCLGRAAVGFNCGTHTEWRRHAGPLGWVTKPGDETCPNCRDDTTPERRSD